MAAGITNKTDVESVDIKLSMAVNPFDNEGIQPHDSKIPETPGEKASNSMEADSWNKAPPFGKASKG